MANENPENKEVDIYKLIPENQCIRIGYEYQADIPRLLARPELRRRNNTDNSVTVWRPTEKFPEEKLNEFILLTKEKFGYNNEQALGMLYWHRYDMEMAIEDLQNFNPIREDLSPDDKLKFEEAYLKFGKNFLRIKQLMPNQEMQILVKHYYLWKNKRKKEIQIEQQTKKLATSRLIENSRDGSNSAESKPDYKTDLGERSSKKICSVCGVFLTTKNQTPQGLMCGTCFVQFRKAKRGIKPTLGSPSSNNRNLNVASNKRQPPREMNDHESIATEPRNQGENIMVAMKDKKRVQSNKQDIGQLKSTESPTPKPISSRWNNKEVMLTIQGMGLYGKNFKMIAKILGTKTEKHLKAFYNHYRFRYNLDEICEEYERQQNINAEMIELGDDKKKQVTKKK